MEKNIMNSTLSNNFVVERGDDGGEYVADEMNMYVYIRRLLSIITYYSL